MAYRVTFRPEAEEDFERLDPQVAQRILRKIRWLSENFELVTPQPLKGEWKGKYKLRVGDYRDVYSVREAERRITVHPAKHRREVYK